MSATCLPHSGPAPFKVGRRLVLAAALLFFWASPGALGAHGSNPDPRLAPAKASAPPSAGPDGVVQEPSNLPLPWLTPQALLHLGLSHARAAAFAEAQSLGSFKAVLAKLTLFNLEARQTGARLDPTVSPAAQASGQEIAFHWYLDELREIYHAALLRHLGSAGRESARAWADHLTVATMGPECSYLVVPLP